MSPEHPRVPFIARTIRKLSVLIILAWVALTLIVTLAVPWLEQVGREHSVPLSPRDAPSVQAMTRMGKVFKESDSDSFAMIVLEGQQQLGDDAHTYYDELVRKLRADPGISSMCRIYGEIDSLRRARKAPMARPFMRSCT